MENNKFFTDANALSEPWIESPFFEKILNCKLKNKEISAKEAELCIKFNNDGYIILDLDVTNHFLNAVNTDVKALSNSAKKQEAGYHYNDSPRVFEGWKNSLSIAQLAANQKILKTLKLLYGRNPLPFQTINFIKGSEQPLHSDSIHFHTLPQKWVAAVWVALEDINEDQGPLMFVPGSHKWPIYNFQDLNLPIPEYGKQFDNYKIYEEFLVSLVETKNLKIEKFIAKKGQALIWATNLLHGGTKQNNYNLTRLSQATHYVFNGVKAYCPMFSNLNEGIISLKDLTKKDILGRLNEK